MQIRLIPSLLALAVAGALSTPTLAADKKVPEGGKSVLTAGGLKGVRLHAGPDDGKYGEHTIIDVKEQPFKQAIRSKVKLRPTDVWNVQLSTLLAEPVKAGDVVLISFWARTIESKNYGGKGAFNVYFGTPETDLEVTASHELTIGDKWTLVQIPATVAASYEAGKGMLNLDLGNDPQTLEFAEIKLLNFGNKVKESELPSTGH
ncbi:MAG: hypothetical protein AB1705_25490 [Verrucomicrobiota bacterium]